MAFELLKDLNSTAIMVVEAALQQGVKVKRVNPKLLIMGRGNNVYKAKISGVPCAFNDKTAKKIVDNKEETSKLLRDKGLPAPANHNFAKDQLAPAWEWAQGLLPVVVKPNKGKFGNKVFINIGEYDEFVYAFNQVTEEFNDVLVEQFVRGEEHRFTYINGKIVAIAKRCPASVIGDGKQTVEQLVQKKNMDKQAKKLLANKFLVIDDESQRILSSQGFTPQSVPSPGLRVFLRHNSNISTGGDSIDVTDNMDKSIIQQIAKVGDVIPGLNVCGIDVLIDESEDNRIINVIEVNASPGFNIHRYPWEGQPRDVAMMLVEAMFPHKQTVSLTGWLHFWFLVLYYRFRNTCKRVFLSGK